MKYTFHQDSPVIPPDMMKTVSCAVNRITRKGRSIGENQKISVLDALKAITKYGAYQYFEENTKGTIAPGKAADFVVLDQNPLTAEPEELADIKVLLTIKENQVVFRKGKEMSKRSKGIILAVITAVMWGIMGIFVRDLSAYEFSNIDYFLFPMHTGRRSIILFSSYHKAAGAEN